MDSATTRVMLVQLADEVLELAKVTSASFAVIANKVQDLEDRIDQLEGVDKPTSPDLSSLASQISGIESGKVIDR